MTISRTILSADAFRVGIRPGAPRARRSRRRCCKKSCPRANHAAHSHGGNGRRARCLCTGSTNKTRRGADVFLGMNPIKDHCHSRTKENIREIRHVYLDLDEGATESLRAIRTSGDVPAPNFVLDTSPEKHQVIWRVHGLDSGSGRITSAILGHRVPRLTLRPPIYPVCCAFPDSQTANTTSNFWCGRFRSRT